MVQLNTSGHRGGHQFIDVNTKLVLVRCTDMFFEEIYKPLAGLPGFARDSKLHLFSLDMIFPTILAPKQNYKIQGSVEMRTLEF